MNNLKPTAWVAASLICAAFPCEAGRPLATEDADILDRADCEWEGFYARETAHRSPSVNGWSTQLSCGVGYATQVALAYGEAHSDGITARSVVLLGKTGLIERKGDGLGLTLAWTIGGVEETHKSLKHDFTQLNLAATQEVVEGVTLHANLGWLRNQIDHRNSATWNIAGEYAVGGGVDVVGEFFGEEHSKPWWGLGTRWQATDALSINAGYAIQSENPRIRQWSVGFLYAF